MHSGIDKISKSNKTFIFHSKHKTYSRESFCFNNFNLIEITFFCAIYLIKKNLYKNGTKSIKYNLGVNFFLSIKLELICIISEMLLKKKKWIWIAMIKCLVT